MCPSPEPLSRSSKNNESQNSVLQFKEVIIYSFYCKAQQRLKDVSVVQQHPQEQPQKVLKHTNRIFYNIDQSMEHPMGRMPQIFCVFGDLYASGTQRAEVTKSLSNVVPFHTMANRMYE